MLGGRQRPGRGPGRGKTRRHMDRPDSPDLAIPPRVLAALGELAAGSVTLLAGRVDGRGGVVAAHPGLRARLRGGGGGRPRPPGGGGRGGGGGGGRWPPP